jgi:hypothetical protein
VGPPYSTGDDQRCCMTTLLVWVSYSTTGERSDLPRAMYMASDSRITWGSEFRRWDAGRKIFAPVKEPHLFGYCGDVVFPSLVLGQLVSAIDQGILFHPETSGDERNASVLASLKTSHQRRQNVEERDFEIVHVYRSQDWPSTEFSPANFYRQDQYTHVRCSIQSPTYLVMIVTTRHSVRPVPVSFRRLLTVSS